MDLNELHKNCALSKFGRLIKSKVLLHQRHHLLHVLQILNKISAILGSCLPISYVQIHIAGSSSLTRVCYVMFFFFFLLFFAFLYVIIEKMCLKLLCLKPHEELTNHSEKLIYLETMRIFLIKGLFKKNLRLENLDLKFTTYLARRLYIEK